MKRSNLDLLFSVSRQRSIRILIMLGVFYILLVSFEVPFVFRSELSPLSQEKLFTSSNNGLLNADHYLARMDENLREKEAPFRPIDDQSATENIRSSMHLSNLNLTSSIGKLVFGSGISKSASEAIELGRKLWRDLESISQNQSNIGINGFSTTSNGPDVENRSKNKPEICPHSISVNGDEFSRNGRILFLPCGLTLGSHVTVVGKPREAHAETETKISLLEEGQYVMVSQFMMELQGLKTVEGEEPPRILHFNPRLKGDFSGKPVIEMNTCYRMQWGISQRCEGWKSQADEETVDDLMKCEKWIRDDDNGSEKSKATWWLNRLIGRTKVPIDWPFPFSEGKQFVLTLTAGLEGYRVSVDGRHIASFPYRTGFSLEDATGLSLNGDIDVHSIVAASLPMSRPNYEPQRHLDLSEKWKAPSISDEPVELFIGILSAGNHFAERMAARKSWMQHKLIKNSNAVARFFVALSARKEVNVEVKKEADFFGDVVIVPYMDNYDLVVLKTVAICEYGVRTLSAKYIMKGDDDTFVRVGAVIDEAKKVPENQSLYIGTTISPFEVEWPEEVYPPYANGPGYIISSDIASYVLSDFESHKLRLFKMEDVSMGMWVERFNSLRTVKYVHSLKFCQFGCIEDYVTAHYQSPRQMICLWNKLRQLGRPLCCNMR